MSSSGPTLRTAFIRRPHILRLPSLRVLLTIPESVAERKGVTIPLPGIQHQAESYPLETVELRHLDDLDISTLEIRGQIAAGHDPSIEQPRVSVNQSTSDRTATRNHRPGYDVPFVANALVLIVCLFPLH